MRQRGVEGGSRYLVRVEALLGMPAAALRYLRAVARLPRVNDGSYWDLYARRSELRGAGSADARVGDEWTGEEGFVAALGRLGDPEKVALEIGCGGGRITAHAASKFARVHACDPSRAMLRSAARSINSPAVSFHLMDGFTLREFGEASIDIVFSHDVFVHFSSLQVFPYLLEINRVLRPGGEALISFYALEDELDEFKRISLEFTRRRRYPDHMRIHFISEPTVRTLAAEAGLTVADVDRENFMVVRFQKPREER